MSHKGTRQRTHPIHACPFCAKLRNFARVHQSTVLEINSGIGELSILINSLLDDPNAHFVTEISRGKYKLLKDIRRLFQN